MLTTHEVQKAIEEQSTLLLDVRKKEELQYGMIPTAKHLPLHELEEAFLLNEDTFKQTYGFSKPTKEQKIICYCRTGGRSKLATLLLRKQGYNVENYEGSIYAWSKIDNTVKVY